MLKQLEMSGLGNITAWIPSSFFYVYLILGKPRSSPRGPFSTVPQGAEVMGPRGPPPLMAPRPLMGAELWQQMPRGPFEKSPRPLMRPGAAVRVSVQSVG